MSPVQFILEEEFIPLISLLKFTGLAETGADASAMVLDGRITCNGKPELRKRYKVRKGDTISLDGKPAISVN